MVDYSICMIVKNEEKCLGSLLPVLVNTGAEIIVVDTGSVDSTVQICKKNNVKLLHFEWVNDFSKARNYSLQAATRPMILWLDADDSPSQEFFGNLPNKNLENCYSIIVKSPVEGAEVQSFRQTRIFPNLNNELGNSGSINKGQVYFQGMIHESVTHSCQKLGLTQRPLDIELIHNGYLLESDRKAKSKRNLALLEKERENAPKDAVFWIEIGNAYFQTGEFKSAERCYLTIFDLSKPEQQSEVGKVVFINLANTYSAMEDLRSYEHYLNESIKNCPNQIEAHYKLAKQYLLEGKVDKGHELLDLGLLEKENIGAYVSSFHSSRANLYGLKGLAYSIVKDNPAALCIFKQSRQEGYNWTIDPWLAIETAFHSNDIETAYNWWLELDDSARSGSNELQIEILNSFKIRSQNFNSDKESNCSFVPFSRAGWEVKLRAVLRGEIGKEELINYSKSLGNKDFTDDVLRYFAQ